ncbi:MAG: glycosyltransferase 87 family protein [Polyangia bacterium]
MITRLFVLGITAAYFDGDTGLYYRLGRSWLDGQIPYRDFPVEYPPAAVTLFAAVAAVGSSFARFRVAFSLLCLAMDGVILAALLRGIGGGGGEDDQARVRAAWLWSVVTACLFPVLYVRYDLVPAAMSVLGVHLLASRAGESVDDKRAAAGGALLGLAVGLKLYPLVLLPFLLLRLRGRGPRRIWMVVTAATCLVVVGTFAPVLHAGAGASALAFLRYQCERGLQVESSYAGLLLLAKPQFHLDLWPAFSHGAHDIAGPMATRAAALAGLLQPAALLAVTALALRRRLPLPRGFAALLAAAILTANVFSPQYLLWLMPFACAVCGPSLRRGAPLLVGIALLTSLLFPALYPALTAGHFGAALVLCARNLLLVALLVTYVERRPDERKMA